MNYKLSKKAFYVGCPDDIHFLKIHGFNMPDVFIEIVYADTPGKAKYKLSKKEDVDFLELGCIRAKNHDLYFFEGKGMTLKDIEYTIKIDKWRKAGEFSAENFPNMKVRIYSGQWGSYWRPGYSGYTFNKEEAGIYTMKDAWEHTSHCGVEKKIEFRKVEQ